MCKKILFLLLILLNTTLRGEVTGVPDNSGQSYELGVTQAPAAGSELKVKFVDRALNEWSSSFLL